MVRTAGLRFGRFPKVLGCSAGAAAWSIPDIFPESLVLSQDCSQADAAEVSFWPVRIGTTPLGFARNAPTRPAWNEGGKSVYRSQGYLRQFSSFLLMVHLPQVFWRRLAWTSWVVPVAGSVLEIPMLPTQHAKVDFLNLSVSFCLEAREHQPTSTTLGCPISVQTASA